MLRLLRARWRQLFPAELTCALRAMTRAICSNDFLVEGLMAVDADVLGLCGSVLKAGKGLEATAAAVHLAASECGWGRVQMGGLLAVELRRA